MKRMIFAILIIATMLLVSGCAQNGDVAEEEMDDVVVDGTADVSEDVYENIDNTADDSILDNTAESIPGNEGTPTEPDNTTPISQEDLDTLKEGIEGLEFEDMGGLSEN